MSSIDFHAPALGPVRERIAARIAEQTEKVISTRTPLDDVPTHRGEIRALKWLLEQLQKPSETTQ